MPTTFDAYPRCGQLPIVPTADLISLTAQINVAGSGRVGTPGGIKRAGAFALRDNGGGVGGYTLVIATGDAPNSPWIAAIGGTVYTPV